MFGTFIYNWNFSSRKLKVPPGEMDGMFGSSPIGLLVEQVVLFGNIFFLGEELHVYS